MGIIMGETASLNIAQQEAGCSESAVSNMGMLSER